VAHSDEQIVLAGVAFGMSQNPTSYGCWLFGRQRETAPAMVEEGLLESKLVGGIESFRITDAGRERLATLTALHGPIRGAHIEFGR